MYTKCPHCEKQRNIKAEELRFSRGMISCEGCVTLFNAFELLQSGTCDNSLADTTKFTDSPANDDAIPNSSELLHAVSNEDDLPKTSDAKPTTFNQDFIPDAANLLRTDAGEEPELIDENTQDSITEKKEEADNTTDPSPDEDTEDEDSFLFEKAPQKGKPIWTWAFSSCLLLLGFQIYYFEGYGLTQNTTVRPWLENICKPLKCQLPAYKNLDEFTILHGSFEPTANRNHYIFKAVFVNQSEFKQNHPSIKLTLQNFNGQTTAERVFRPQDYLKNGQNQIKPEQSVEIIMNIVTPSEKMGGYSFELI